MKFLICFSLLWGSAACATEIRWIGQTTVEDLKDAKSHKTKMGGLSGLVFDEVTQLYYAVSDDRGRYGDPRIYSLEITATTDSVKAKIKELILIKGLKNKRLDLEAITFLPWGNFLISSEGNGGRKPRIPPQLLDVKKKGDWSVDYEIPEMFIPEPTGLQKKGVMNNLAFEGLARNPNGQSWIAAVEGPLEQEKDCQCSRFLEYTSPEAWVIKPGSQWAYKQESKAPQTGFAKYGVSEVIFKDEKKLWVLERMFEVSPKMMGFNGFIFEVELSKDKALTTKDALKAEDPRYISKKKIMEMKDIWPKGLMIQNFEGMAWGPTLPSGERVLFLISDDGFSSDFKTQVVALAVRN